jgi:hypothetical protein
MRALAALLGLLLLAAPPSARAGGSSPVLTIAAADAFASSSGVVSVSVLGSFNFEDVVQGVFPAGVVVFQGTSFARFDQAGGVVAGSASLLSDGLDAAEVPALLSAGSAAPAPAALALLRADRVTVVLPPGFSAGAASVVLYAVYQGQGLASNTLSVILP